jgi:hypothetical protein
MATIEILVDVLVVLGIGLNLVMFIPSRGRQGYVHLGACLLGLLALMAGRL